MAPKAAAKAAKAAQDAAEPDAVESRRLQDAAFDAGVLSRTRRLSSTILPPTKLMLRADGKDITKKASHRKGRYLLVFNFQLAPAAAGKLGTLTHLDSKNPILYLDFPRGRYKLFGTLVFPRNKYLVLKMGQKEVLCEDVLESMVVFSEGWWVGTAEENPKEKKLPEPDWLAQPALHQKYDFSGRGTAGGGGAAGGGTAADVAEEEDEDEDEGPASQRPTRRARQAAGGKRLRYHEDSGGAEEDSDDADSDEAAPRKLQRLGGQKQQRKAQARQEPGSHPIDLAASDSDGAAKDPLAARAPKPAQATLDGFLKRTGQAAKPAAKQSAKPKAAAATAKAKPAAKAAAGKRRAAAQSDSEDGSLDAADGGSSSSSGKEVDDDDAPPSSARPRSQRRAAGEAAKRLRIEDDSEDEDEAAGAASSADEDSGGVSEGSESEGDEYEPSD